MLAMAALSLWKVTSPTSKELVDTVLVNVGGYNKIGAPAFRPWNRNFVTSCTLNDKGDVEYDVNQVSVGLLANVAHLPTGSNKFQITAEYRTLMDVGVSTSALAPGRDCSIQLPKVAVRTTSFTVTYDGGEMEICRWDLESDPNMILTTRLF